MTKTGNDKLMNDKLMIALKNVVPLAVLAMGVVMTFTRAESKIEQLRIDYDKISAAEEVQDENIDQNEDAIIGIKKDLTFILDRQDVMRSEQMDTAKEILRKLDALSR